MPQQIIFKKYFVFILILEKHFVNDSFAHDLILSTLRDRLQISFVYIYELIRINSYELKKSIQINLYERFLFVQFFLKSFGKICAKVSAVRLFISETNSITFCTTLKEKTKNL